MGFLVLEVTCCPLSCDFSFRPLLWEGLSGCLCQVFSIATKVEFCVRPYFEFYRSDRWHCVHSIPFSFEVFLCEWKDTHEGGRSGSSNAGIDSSMDSRISSGGGGGSLILLNLPEHLIFSDKGWWSLGFVKTFLKRVSSGYIGHLHFPIWWLSYVGTHDKLMGWYALIYKMFWIKQNQKLLLFCIWSKMILLLISVK